MLGSCATPRALPRAWIVHEARQERSETALRLLQDGAVDPRRTVFLEKQVPEMAPVLILPPGGRGAGA